MTSAPSPNPVPPVPVALGYIEDHETLAQHDATEPEAATPEELDEGAEVIHALSDPANDEIIEHLKHAD